MPKGKANPKTPVVTKFKVGDKVRVKHGIRDTDYPDMPLGGWAGNHDFGLCDNPSDKIRAKYPASVTEFMTTLRPRLELAGCYFAHVEPWLDPKDIADLWFFEGPPDSDGRLQQIFDAVPHRLMFAGHYHRWLLARPDGIAEWQGECPVRLHNGRYFVVVGGLLEGRYAVFDTDTSELVPCEVEVCGERRC